MEFSLPCARFYVYTELINSTETKEIHKKLQQCWKEKAPSMQTVYRWCADFKAGKRQSFDDVARCGRPLKRTSEAIQSIKQCLDEDNRLTIRMMEEITEIPRETIRTILTSDLGMTKVCSIWVPYHLTDGHKLQRVECAKRLLNLYDSMEMSELKKKWVIEDETWVTFTPQPWQSDSKVWHKCGGPRSKKARLTNSAKKTMVLLSFSNDGKFCLHGTQKDETVNSEVYCQFVQKTLNKFRRERASKRVIQKQLLWQHDNARPHVSQSTVDFFSKRHIHLIKQSPYSPDLNLCDRWLNKALKKVIKHTVYLDVESVLAACRRFMQSISNERYEEELLKFKRHLNHVIECEGDWTVV